MLSMQKMWNDLRWYLNDILVVGVRCPLCWGSSATPLTEASWGIDGCCFWPQHVYVGNGCRSGQPFFTIGLVVS